MALTKDQQSPLMDTPQWSVNLNLIYSTELQRIGRLTIRGDYSWRDKSYKDAINTEELVQDAYGDSYLMF